MASPPALPPFPALPPLAGAEAWHCAGLGPCWDPTGLIAPASKPLFISWFVLLMLVLSPCIFFLLCTFLSDEDTGFQCSKDAEKSAPFLLCSCLCMLPFLGTFIAWRVESRPVFEASDWDASGSGFVAYPHPSAPPAPPATGGSPPWPPGLPPPPPPSEGPSVDWFSLLILAAGLWPALLASCCFGLKFLEGCRSAHDSEQQGGSRRPREGNGDGDVGGLGGGTNLARIPAFRARRGPKVHLEGQALVEVRGAPRPADEDLDPFVARQRAEREAELARMRGEPAEPAVVVEGVPVVVERC